jgi:hypothetical protein
MTVQVFNPQISIVLKKNIGRATIDGSVAASTRFTGTSRNIDLTPYLGEEGSVVTQKSVRAPAGMFSITLADKLTSGEHESLYGVIEPMDVIEIRMARDTSKYVSGGYAQNMPLMMRGFVTDIARSEEMTGDGPDARPVRLRLYGNGSGTQFNAATPSGVRTSDAGQPLIIGNRSGLDRTWEGGISALVIFRGSAPVPPTQIPAIEAGLRAYFGTY